MNDYIINQFVGTDTGRKSLLIPGEIDGYTYATDANSVIRIKSELLAFKYITPDKFPKADSVYKNFEGNPLEVDIQEISQQIAQFRYSLLGRTCEKCCGEGTITCGHCDSEYTCKECSGDGRSASGHVFKKTWFYDKADDHARMKVGNRWYSPLQIERVMIVAKFCGLDKFLILNDNKDREGARIDIGPFELVVIPLLID